MKMETTVTEVIEQWDAEIEGDTGTLYINTNVGVRPVGFYSVSRIIVPISSHQLIEKCRSETCGHHESIGIYFIFSIFCQSNQTVLWGTKIYKRMQGEGA